MNKRAASDSELLIMTPRVRPAHVQRVLLTERKEEEEGGGGE